jgi:glycosyltransferase involved in cell wall biosynthesis
MRSREFKRVLCLDIEGGYGGSSRSLFQSLAHLPGDAIQPEVWCRRAGPIQAAYAGANIPCVVTPAMPHVSALPRLSRNLYAFTRARLRFAAAKSFRAELRAAANERFDVVHFNHEALFLLARWLRPRTQLPFTMHIRTNLVPSSFARWQARLIARNIDHAVFITENEQRTWRSLGLHPRGESVIYNIAGRSAEAISPHPDIPDDGRFKIASLSNFAWIRGVDRFVDIAAALAARGRRDVLFVMAGDMSLRGALPGELGALARRGGTLADYAAARGVGDMFLFLGHVSEPERVLAGCDALARLSREDNPWGRDVIEALGAGRPVIATGRYDRFVEMDRTGILLPTFSAEALAENILRLADDRGLAAEFGTAAQARIATLCDGPARAAELAAFWRGVARG